MVAVVLPQVSGAMGPSHLFMARMARLVGSAEEMGMVDWASAVLDLDSSRECPTVGLQHTRQHATHLLIVPPIFDGSLR